MSVMVPLLGDCRLESEISAPRLIVVTDKDPGVIRQCQQALTRFIQRLSVPTREVAPGGTCVGHKQGVTDKQGVTNQVSHTSGCVAGHMERKHIEAPKREGIAVGQHKIELATVPAKAITLSKYRSEDLLHRCDLRANRNLSTELLTNVGRAGEMVGVNVGFEDVAQAEVVVSDVLNDFICGLCAQSAGRLIKVQHRVNDGRYSSLSVTDHIGKGRGTLIVEVLYSLMA